MSKLTLSNAQDWSFLNGPWRDGSAGELIPPDGNGIECMAVKHSETYGDFSATFRFKFRYSSGGARFLFRVQDSQRYYALEIPVGGQQFRSRHFWAGMLIADGTALQRYLKFGLVPGLCARLETWYEARVEVKGTRLRGWINDIPVADVGKEAAAAGGGGGEQPSRG